MVDPYNPRWLTEEGVLGGTDDSLLLLDYLRQCSARRSPRDGEPVALALSAVVDELHLLTDDAWFEAAGGYEAHFVVRDQVLLELAAIVTECRRNGAVALRALDAGSEDGSVVRIEVDDQGVVARLVSALEAFAGDVGASPLSDLVDADDLSRYAIVATAVAADLGGEDRDSPAGPPRS